MACSMRELIFVTLETSSSESSFFSRALRNLSPNSPTVEDPSGVGNIIGQPARVCYGTRGQGRGNFGFWGSGFRSLGRGIEMPVSCRIESQLVLVCMISRVEKAVTGDVA